MIKRVSLDKLIGMNTNPIFGSKNLAGENVALDPTVKLDPVLENFLGSGNEGELKLPGEREWKEGDSVVDPRTHPRDLQEMRAHQEPAKHIEPCNQEEADEIFRNLKDSVGGPEIPDLHNILGWS